ncbi:MAG: hypothetical protein NZ518_10500, partial [Dehalococcoidia bacterium]|nr:hypothetical protein [Dehalococcoidia bacterium]
MTTRERTPEAAEARMVAQIAQRDRARLARYAEALTFFGGDQWVGAARAGERRLTFNYARVFVEKVTSYVMAGRQVIVSPTDDGPTARAHAERATMAMAAIAEDNDLESLDYDTELDAAVLG